MLTSRLPAVTPGKYVLLDVSGLPPRSEQRGGSVPEGDGSPGRLGDGEPGGESRPRDEGTESRTAARQNVWYTSVYILDARSFYSSFLLANYQMPEFRVRVDRDAIDEQFVAYLKERTTRYVLVHHTPGHGENPHYHAYVETKYTANNWSTYLKKAFNLSGNQEYSSPKCDPDRRLEYIQYLFNTKKGNVARLVAYDGFSPLDIATHMENATQVAKEFDAKLKAAKKLTKFDIAERVAASYGVNTHPHVIYDAIVELLHKNRMCSGIFVIKDIMATTLAMNNSHQLRDAVCKNFLD